MKRHRDKWEPTKHSVLCSLHFEQSCFTSDTILVQSLGLGKKRPILKPDAVPTLFTKPVTLKRKSEMDQPPSTCKKRKVAFEKRERCRVRLDLPTSSYNSR